MELNKSTIVSLKSILTNINLNYSVGASKTSKTKKPKVKKSNG